MTYTKIDGIQCEVKFGDTRSCDVEVDLPNADSTMTKQSKRSSAPRWLKAFIGLALIIDSETAPSQPKGNSLPRPEDLYRNTGYDRGQAASAMLYMDIVKVFQNKNKNCTDLRRIDYTTNSSKVDGFLNKVEYVGDKGGLRIPHNGTYHVFSQVTLTSAPEKSGCIKSYDGRKLIHEIRVIKGNSSEIRAVSSMIKLPASDNRPVIQPSYLSANLRLEAGDVVYVYVSNIYFVYRVTTVNYLGLLQL